MIVGLAGSVSASSSTIGLLEVSTMPGATAERRGYPLTGDPVVQLPTSCGVVGTRRSMIWPSEL